MSYQYITTKKIDQLESLVINHPKFTAQLTLFGAQILSFAPTGQTDVFWLSNTAQFDGNKPIRGGVPLCWPWFGPAKGDFEGEPQHGYIRNVQWQLVSVQESADNVVLTLTPELPKPLLEKLGLKVEVQYEFSSSIKMAIITENTGSEDVELSQAIHSYFAVADINDTALLGLEDCAYIDKLSNVTKHQNTPVVLTQAADRVYLDENNTLTLQTPKRSLIITGQGYDSVVVWNPWQEGAKAMADFDDDGYQTMMCVEMANTQGLTLPPGKCHTISQMVNIKKPA